MKEKGFVQVYTGDGKGKTTAAAGLAARALGAGKNVLFAQFMKKGGSPEFETLASAGPRFLHRPFGSGRFIKSAGPSAAELARAARGLAECRAALASGEWFLVVMDEACGAVGAGLFSEDELLDAVRARHPRTELVVTGRNAPPGLLKIADLVTEMREVRHYFRKGVAARRGIEK